MNLVYRSGYVLVSILLGILILFLSILVFILVILKIIRYFYKFPIPAILTRVIDNPFRRRFIQRPDVLVERMQLESGMIVVEIGPGKGTYTLAVAEKILPDGKVYTVDIQESVIEQLKMRIAKEGISNIIPKIDNVYNFSFTDESVDRVLANACLPEIPVPIKVLQECYRILKPDGLVCLCELFPDPDYPRRKTEKRWAEEAGLELRQEFGNWFAYQLNFGKKSE